MHTCTRKSERLQNKITINKELLTYSIYYFKLILFEITPKMKISGKHLFQYFDH
jgi:hypothetical protein